LGLLYRILALLSITYISLDDPASERPLIRGKPCYEQPSVPPVGTSTKTEDELHLPAREFYVLSDRSHRLGGRSARSTHPADPRQGCVLHIATVLLHQDFGTAFAYCLQSDVANHLIYADRVSVFIEPPNGYAFFAWFHTPANASRR
jgi:hypothetical protein